ncbi:MAG: thiol peroxidase [Phycisphaeraceae bacterium]|nr:thiol peroxidase [Phycisphaeraceae bacterium]
MKQYHLALLGLALALLGASCSSTDRAAAPPAEPGRTGVVSIRGKPATLEGTTPPIGAPAPDFTAVAIDMTEKRLSDYRGKTVILSTVPSIDTAVCDRETRTFNERAASLDSDVVILTVSMDLPFAQKRWCGAEGIDRVVMLSDSKNREAGKRYGVLIRENGLLARAVFVIDAQGVVRYEEVVADVSSEPDYDAAIAAARNAGGR